MINELKQWFKSQKRDLPWRHDPTPYMVWISEVMLQQTQVSVVIPYFIRWMDRFPTVQSLAQASLDEVIKMWEGLGYYSRARCLHEGAKYIVEHFQGQLPDQEPLLKKIKGLGPYTIGAILSFAFHKKIAAVDGNVMRVLARYFGIEEQINKTSTIKLLRQRAEDLLPEEESWIVNEALIELGATICQKKAKCLQCPLKASCKSHLYGMADRLPNKGLRPKTEYLYRAVAVIKCQNSVLIKRGEKGKVMSDLHEFPYFEITEKGIKEKELSKLIEKKFGVKVEIGEKLPSVSHAFTRYQVKLDPVLVSCATQFHLDGTSWVLKENLLRLAFSSGHRRILSLLQK